MAERGFFSCFRLALITAQGKEPEGALRLTETGSGRRTCSSGCGFCRGNGQRLLSLVPTWRRRQSY